MPMFLNGNGDGKETRPSSNTVYDGSMAVIPVPVGQRLAQTPRPWGQSHWTVPAPGAQYPRSPYVGGAHGAGTTSSALRIHVQRSADPRLAGIPDTPPRRRPIPLPPQMEGVTSVALHPALVVRSGRDTHLFVDFASVLNAGSNAASYEWLSAPATSPALPSLTIESPCLPWAITAHPSGSVGRFGILTVADVISAIYDALGRQVDRGEFEDWETMMKARSGSHRPTRRLSYRKGMTRLDLLQGKTRFAGLGASTMGCDIWVLEVA
ncbi:hypothetical protein K438DRAFT_1674771 [Mycena galopus ATCC 62051]|nr:hypothetical protein K438DRAFT_1674771 [Mycena galopus ATCC 62051]